MNPDPAHPVLGVVIHWFLLLMRQHSFVALTLISGKFAGSVLIFLPGFALALSAILTFARVPGVVNQMAASGFADGKLVLVASLELLSAVLFLYPRTRSLGLLVLSAFLGGAISTHVQLGEYAKIAGPCALLSVAWIGIWLRHPQVLWCLSAPYSRTTQSPGNRWNDGVPRSA